MPSVDIFTFITVYYKHGEYGSQEFKTLREGLQEFLENYISGSDSHEDGIRRQQLEALPDEELLTEILKIGVADPFFLTQLSFTLLVSLAGSERIENQVGQGLVAVVKGPRSGTKSNSCVYLEIYYKHGEWSVSQGWSRYIDEALDELEREMEKDGMLQEWEDMSAEDQEDLALERCQENVSNQRGWGAVLMVPGSLVAQA